MPLGKAISQGKSSELGQIQTSLQMKFSNLSPNTWYHDNLLAMLLFVFVILRYHRMGDLTRQLFLRAMGLIKTQGADWISSWWRFSSCLADGQFLLYLTRKRQKELSSIPSYKDNNPIMKAPPSWPHPPHYLPIALSPNNIILEVSDST